MTLEVGCSNHPSRAMEKLYIVTRNDLPPGAQCAQACHGLSSFVAEHPELYKAWHESSNNIAVLQAPSEEALLELAGKAEARGIAYAQFREPDFGDSVTAVALGEGGDKLTSCLPLALRSQAE